MIRTRYGLTSFNAIGIAGGREQLLYSVEVMLPVAMNRWSSIFGGEVFHLFAKQPL